MKTAYFILGMHRSGTSALGGVLNIMGLDFGSNLMQGDKNNPKGYYENNFIYELNESILKENKSSWDDYNFNINEISIEKKEIYINNITKLLDNEFKYSENFVIKDPRICLLFPLWEEACSKQNINIKVILAHRNPIEVAQSLKTRNNFSQEKSLLLWSKYFLNAEYLSRKYNRIAIFFDDLIKKQDATIKEILSFTNFDIEDTTKKEIVQFLDKSIKHNNLSLQNISKDIPSFLYEIIEIIKNKDFSNEKVLDKCRNDFKNSLNLYHHIELANRLKEEIQKRKLLESITDVTIFDENYYTNKYQDILKYEGSKEEHYFKYGKKEGRFPNKYCEINNILTKDTISKDEHIYNKNIVIQILSSEKENLITDLNTKKEENSNLAEQNSTLKNTIKDLNEKKDNLENNYNQKIQEIEVLNKNIDEIVKETKQNLVTDLNTKKEENSNLAKQNSTLKNTIKDLNEKKDNLENNYNQKTKEIEALNTNINEILNDLETVKQSKQNLVTDLNTKKEENSNLAEQNSTLKNKIKDLNEKKDNLENNYNQKIQEIEALNKNIDETLNEMINDSEKVKKENSNLLIDVQNLNKSKQEFKNKYNLKVQEVVDLNKNIDEILNDLEQIKESKQLIINDKVQEIENLHININNIQNNLESVKKSKQNITNELNTQKVDNKNLTKENLTLSANIQELNIEKNKLSKQYNLKTQEVIDLNKDIDEMLEDIELIKESKQKVMIESNTKLESLKADHSNLKAKLKEKEKELSVIISEHLKLNNEHKIIKSQNSELSNKLEVLRAEHTELNTNLDKIVEDLASIKESKCWIYTKPIRNLRNTLKGQ